MVRCLLPEALRAETKQYLCQILMEVALSAAGLSAGKIHPVSGFPAIFKLVDIYVNSSQ
jgi:hypothetical protein